MRAYFVAVLSVLSVCLAAPVSAAGRDIPLLPAGTMAPDFTAYAWTGGYTHLSDYRGNIVVLDFWATWCPPCNASMPHLEKIYEKYHDDGVVVLALCSWDSPANANRWIPAHDYQFTYALDPAGRPHISTGAISNAYNVSGIPTTYIIDKDGMIVAADTVMSEDDIAAALEKLGARTADEKAHDAKTDKSKDTAKPKPSN